MTLKLISRAPRLGNITFEAIRSTTSAKPPKFRSVVMVRLAVVLIAILGFADTGIADQSDCQVTVTSVNRIGDKHSRTFFPKVPNQVECKKSAQLHETNFEPGKTKHKQVSWKWHDR